MAAAPALLAVMLGACSPATAPPAVGSQALAVERPMRLDAPVASSVLRAAQACAELGSLALPGGGRITGAALSAPGLRARDPAGNREVGEPLPEHCIVVARLDERVGEDGKPYYTGFELRLPSTFSGRFFYQGGGGNDGVIRNAVGRNTGADGWGNNALQRGYAVVATDAGHQSPGPEFGLDPQARVEHAWRAHQRTAEVAKHLVNLYYGRPADKSYFVGCSGGGRQGMMFTQRFPELFDGVIAIAPAMRVSEGATIAAAWTVQQFLAAAPKGADGKPILAKALEPSQLDAVANRVLQACDASDGLQDGLVHNPSCTFNPNQMLCPGGGASSGPDCLSATQAKALTAMMSGPSNAKGPLYFGWPWDPGMAAADWRNWTLGTAPSGPANARHVTLMSGALGHEFVTPPDPTLTVLNFNFERDPARMKAFHTVYDTADDTELLAFRRRGGKLLLFHGLADPIFSAFETMDYQRRVNENLGPHVAAQSVRSFMVPGMNHCAGGPATDRFDGLAALEAWVEEGKAPQRIVATGSGAVSSQVSRPLCPWPRYAHFLGGNSNFAASFECRQP